MSDSSRRLVGLLLLAAIVGAGAYFAWPREKPPAPEPPPVTDIPMTSSASPPFTPSIYKSVEPTMPTLARRLCGLPRGETTVLPTHGTQQGFFGREPAAEPPDGAFEHKKSNAATRLSQGRPARHEKSFAPATARRSAGSDVPVRYLVGSGHFHVQP